jgi:hypothetical protein
VFSRRSVGTFVPLTTVFLGSKENLVPVGKKNHEPNQQYNKPQNEMK